jgi:hemerythrin superfamily protein
MISLSRPQSVYRGLPMQPSRQSILVFTHAAGLPMTDNIFEALRESHEIQRSLMRKLILSKTGAHRVNVFTQLRIELAAHEAAEERYLYAPMLMDDRGLHSSRDALADHHKMDMIVEDLQTPDHAGRSWVANVRKLSKELHDHLREEEKKFFKLAGKILDESTKSSLAKKYRKDYQRLHEKLSQA